MASKKNKYRNPDSHGKNLRASPMEAEATKKEAKGGTSQAGRTKTLVTYKTDPEHDAWNRMVEIKKR